MFTGLIEEVGTLSGSEATERGLRLEVEAAVVLQDLDIGASISIDGVCQTVVSKHGARFAVEAMAPTLARTTLGLLRPGSRVNLERALALGARLGGHMVQGHVDALAGVAVIEQVSEHALLSILVSDDVADVSVLHGSIAINGVSLTINQLPGGNIVQVALIPHTWDNTNLSDLRIGDAVNVEGDMLGKFVVEYMKRRGAHAI